MAKLTLLVATFALFLLLANASIYRTTVVIDEEENPRSESCDQQFQQARQLQQCQMYMRQQSQQGGQWDNQQQHLRECCRQLQQLDTRCRCQGLEQALRRQQQQGQYRGGQEMYETASEIPRMCNIEPRRGCDFRSPYNSV